MQYKKWWRIFLPGIIVVVVFLNLCSLNSAYRGDQAESGNSAPVFKPVEIPDTVYFAGELLPVHRFDVRENLDRELLVNSYFHSQTIRFIKLVPRYFPVIEPILREKGVPDDIKYLGVAEGNLDLRSVSPAGAVGFWQFMRNTGIEYGLEINNEVDERYHLEKATRAACDYLLAAYRKYGNWMLVAAAYNSGPNFVSTQIAKQKSTNYFDLLLGEETERYVYRIVALKLVLEHSEKYGFLVNEDEKYPLIETREVEITGPVNDFAAFSQDYGLSYKMFKTFNPWLRENKLTNQSGKKYFVKIPLDIESVKSLQ